jgi:hypothetical protein
MTAPFKRILRKIRSGKIQNKIGTGKIVYFLNPLEEIAFKYVPGKFGKSGKYYAKYYGQNEFEIDYDSSCILLAVMEGKQISKARYDNYHLVEGVSWNRSIKTNAAYNAAAAT